MRSTLMQYTCGHKVTFRCHALPKMGDMIWCYKCAEYVAVIGEVISDVQQLVITEVDDAVQPSNCSPPRSRA